MPVFEKSWLLALDLQTNRAYRKNGKTFKKLKVIFIRLYNRGDLLMKYGYVTLLSTENYLDAVLVLNESLKANNAQYPLIAMVPQDLVATVRPKLEKADIVIEIIKRLQYSEKTCESRADKAVLNTASKIEIFTLTRWDKLVYLDADTVVLKNCDELFEYPDGAMLKTADETWGFSGLFVIEPARHYEYPFYLTLLQNQDCFDGDLLGKTWFFVQTSEIHQIPEKYLRSYIPQISIPSDTVILHYINEDKPWLNPNSPRYDVGYYGAWIYMYYFDKIKKF